MNQIIAPRTARPPSIADAIPAGITLHYDALDERDPDDPSPAASIIAMVMRDFGLAAVDAMVAVRVASCPFVGGYPDTMRRELYSAPGSPALAGLICIARMPDAFLRQSLEMLTPAGGWRGDLPGIIGLMGLCMIDFARNLAKRRRDINLDEMQETAPPSVAPERIARAFDQLVRAGILRTSGGGMWFLDPCWRDAAPPVGSGGGYLTWVQEHAQANARRGHDGQ